MKKAHKQFVSWNYFESFETTSNYLTKPAVEKGSREGQLLFNTTSFVKKFKPENKLNSSNSQNTYPLFSRVALDLFVHD